ncbi:MAG: enoyl-CoA hydratase, partial [Bacillati bacterium ANGP1]
FGQPEIRLGLIPGAGGTQRLTRAIGKSRAMELILTGRSITAAEAYALGLVSRVVPVELYLDEAKALARDIAAQPPIAVRMAKEAVLQAFETPLGG